MRVAIQSYPMLFQSRGGLQVQVLETVAALCRIGIEARLIDPNRERLAKFDLVHVFSVINGTHRIVEKAHALGVPVVVSPLIRPYWTKRLGRRARLAENITWRLSGGDISTEYRQITSALSNSNQLIALGEIERQCIIAAFGVAAERIQVIPNGINTQFFLPDPAPFCSRFGVDPGYVLQVSSIDSHKNPLGLAKALAGSGIQVVVAGECLPLNAAYLAELQTFPHVRYVGALDHDDPYLASAYAGAGALCLPSNSEVMPLVVLEALAAGTPVVMTRNHCMDLGGMSAFVHELDPRSGDAIRSAVGHWLNQPPQRHVVSSAVQHLTWDKVAAQVSGVYAHVHEQLRRSTERVGAPARISE